MSSKASPAKLTINIARYGSGGNYKPFKLRETKTIADLAVKYSPDPAEDVEFYKISESKMRSLWRQAASKDQQVIAGKSPLPPWHALKDGMYLLAVETTSSSESESEADDPAAAATLPAVSSSGKSGQKDKSATISGGGGGGGGGGSSSNSSTSPGAASTASSSNSISTAPCSPASASSDDDNGPKNWPPRGPLAGTISADGGTKDGSYPGKQYDIAAAYAASNCDLADCLQDRWTYCADCLHTSIAMDLIPRGKIADPDWDEVASQLTKRYKPQQFGFQAFSAADCLARLEFMTDYRLHNYTYMNSRYSMYEQIAESIPKRSSKSGKSGKSGSAGSSGTSSSGTSSSGTSSSGTSSSGTSSSGTSSSGTSSSGSDRLAAVPASFFKTKVPRGPMAGKILEGDGKQDGRYRGKKKDIEAAEAAEDYDLVDCLENRWSIAADYLHIEIAWALVPLGGPFEQDWRDVATELNKRYQPQQFGFAAFSALECICRFRYMRSPNVNVFRNDYSDSRADAYEQLADWIKERSSSVEFLEQRRVEANKRAMDVLEQRHVQTKKRARDARKHLEEAMKTPLYLVGDESAVRHVMGLQRVVDDLMEAYADAAERYEEAAEKQAASSTGYEEGQGEEEGSGYSSAHAGKKHARSSGSSAAGSGRPQKVQRR